MQRGGGGEGERGSGLVARHKILRHPVSGIRGHTEAAYAPAILSTGSAALVQHLIRYVYSVMAALISASFTNCSSGSSSCSRRNCLKRIFPM